MPDTVVIIINGRPHQVAEQSTVAAALLTVGETLFRTSVSGQGRGPLCGMGICMECRVEIDGVPARLSCQTPVRSGMEVRTGG